MPSVTSGNCVIPITSPPTCANIFDSARVENRGPSITTIVPPSRCAIPIPAAVETSASRISGQYGSANDTCVVTGPSKNVYARDFVKSIA